MRKHDPELSAASYLSGTLSKRARRRFEEHLLECNDCWSEVETGRAGRTVAESGRDIAPQELRERVRTTISTLSEPRPHRPWFGRISLGVAAMIVIGAVAIISLGDDTQPAPIQAVLADFEDPSMSSPTEAKLPRRLGDMELTQVSTGRAGGMDVTVHRYTDAAGHEVAVYQASHTFPVAEGAEFADDDETWRAAIGGAVLYCADHPKPSLVLGDDELQVEMAANELGLR